MPVLNAHPRMVQAARRGMVRCRRCARSYSDDPRGQREREDGLDAGAVLGEGTLVTRLAAKESVRRDADGTPATSAARMSLECGCAGAGGDKARSACAWHTFSERRRPGCPAVNNIRFGIRDDRERQAVAERLPSEVSWDLAGSQQGLLIRRTRRRRRGTPVAGRSVHETLPQHRR
jgi:hypothetical protein